MNKFTKILLAIIGGIDVTFSMFLPIIVAALWIDLNGFNNWTSYLLFGIGGFATLFRAIKLGSGGDLSLYSDLVNRFLGVKKQDE